MKTSILLLFLLLFLFQPQTALCIESVTPANVEVVAAVKPTKKARRLERLVKRLNDDEKKKPTILIIAIIAMIVYVPLGLLLALIAKGVIKKNPGKYHENSLKQAKTLVTVGIVLMLLAVVLFGLLILAYSGGF